MSLFQGACERHWLRLVTGGALAAGAIALTAPGASASGTSIAANGLGASGMCPNVRAGGHNYDVHALNVACSFADRWASSLAGRRLKAGAENVEIPSGPPGYSCQATAAPLAGIRREVQTFGECTKSNEPSGLPSFQWQVWIPL